VLREGAGGATQRTTEARSEVQVGHTTGRREERGASGASGARNGREQRASKRAERRVGRAVEEGRSSEQSEARCPDGTEARGQTFPLFFFLHF
jgi:hypothetical protein